MTESIIKELERILDERFEDYGPADQSFSLVAELWSKYLTAILKSEGLYITEEGLEGLTYFEMPLGPKHVAHMMMLLKIARTAFGGDKRDTYLDIAGYAALAAEL